MRKKEEAFSLIEAAIFLGIIGLVIGGIWVAASSVSDYMKANQLKTQILQIYQKGTPLFRGSTAYADDVTSVFSTGGLAPAEMIKGNALGDPWGKDVKIYAFTTTSQQRIGIQFSGHSEEECAYIINRVMSKLPLTRCGGQSTYVVFPESENSVFGGSRTIISIASSRIGVTANCAASNGIFGLDIPMCQ